MVSVGDCLGKEKSKKLMFSNILLQNTLDFDFICESVLPDQCAVSDVTDQFPVGRAKYDVVIVPGCEMLRGTTLERLEALNLQKGHFYS